MLSLVVQFNVSFPATSFALSIPNLCEVIIGTYDIVAGQQKAVELAQVGGDVFVQAALGYQPTGEDARKELEHDVRRFRRDISPANRKLSVRTGVRAYQVMIERLLALHPSTILVNCGDEYSRAHRKQGFGSFGDEASLAHHVLIPYAPGGFLRAQGDVTWEAGDLTIGRNCWQDYFAYDRRGAATDDVAFNERNGQSSLAIKDFMGDVSRAVWNAHMGKFS